MALNTERCIHHVKRKELFGMKPRVHILFNDIGVAIVCVCYDVCQGGVSSIFCFILPSDLYEISHVVDTIVTDSFCCAKRKTAFKIHVFKSNYYSSI